MRARRARSVLFLGGLLGLAVGMTACASLSLFGPSSAPPAETPSEAIAKANEELRRAITEAMLRAAQTLGLAIDKERIVFVSRDDLVVAHTPVSGFETLEVGSDGVADVGLVYLRLPVTANVKQFTGERKPIPPDFYVVRIYPPQNKVTLLNAFGRPGATLRLDTAGTWPSPRPQIDVAGCKVLLRYVQEQTFLGPPPIRAEVPLDWCQD